MTRGLLPAALVAIGLITFIRGDLAGDHRLLAVGVAIVGAAILTAIAGWVLRRPDEAAQVDRRDWTSYLTQSTERGFLIVRPDQAEGLVLATQPSAGVNPMSLPLLSNAWIVMMASHRISNSVDANRQLTDFAPMVTGRNS